MFILEWALLLYFSRHLHPSLYAFQYTMWPLKKTVPSYLSRFWGFSDWATFGNDGLLLGSFGNEMDCRLHAMAYFWNKMCCLWTAMASFWNEMGSLIGCTWWLFVDRLQSSQDKYDLFLHIWIVHRHTYLLILSMYWPQGISLWDSVCLHKGDYGKIPYILPKSSFEYYIVTRLYHTFAALIERLLSSFWATATK
jgi:hypothetical protein